MKTAAALIIGDEILTGKTKDENTLVLAEALFDRGVTLKKVEILPDIVSEIAGRINFFTKRVDYLITSGGVGPTHDDRTLESISKAFNLPLIINKEAYAYFDKCQRQSFPNKEISPTQEKMLAFPKGSEIFFTSELWLPLVKTNNVYIFPGVPYLFKTLMKNFSHLFMGEKFYRKLLYVHKGESDIASDLEQIQLLYPNVSIGSYPKGLNKITLSVEGLNERYVNDASLKIREQLDAKEKDEQ